MPIVIKDSKGNPKELKIKQDWEKFVETLQNDPGEALEHNILAGYHMGLAPDDIAQRIKAGRYPGWYDYGWTDYSDLEKVLPDAVNVTITRNKEGTQGEWSCTLAWGKEIVTGRAKNMGNAIAIAIIVGVRSKGLKLDPKELDTAGRLVHAN